MTCANHPDRENVAFCQNCGKPLCAECVRNLGTSILCEPCLAIRTSASGYATTGYTANPYADPGVPPVAPDEPNPGLAAILGFIPGVGAMYNGQYAKGIVHLFVFFILVSLTSDVNGLFGIFIGGWVLYQVIEAHHTARARRDGTPLPNPFGLNDLAERMGFGKAWPQGSGAPAAPYTPSAGPGPYVPPAPSANPYPGPVSSWGAPPDTSSYGVPFVPITPLTSANPPYDPAVPYPRRFPAGAVWLIGLGCLFLFGNSGLFHVFSAKFLVPILLIGAGVYNFVRGMTAGGGGFENDGTPMYTMRLARAFRGSMFLILLGVLFLLNSLHVLTWSHSWPLFLIALGVAAFLNQSIYSPYGGGMPNQGPGYPYTPQRPAPSAGTVPGSEIVTTHPDAPQGIAHDDREGR